jgi:hypothetical protein
MWFRTCESIFAGEGYEWRMCIFILLDIFIKNWYTLNVFTNANTWNTWIDTSHHKNYSYTHTQILSHTDVFRYTDIYNTLTPHPSYRMAIRSCKHQSYRRLQPSHMPNFHIPRCHMILETLSTCIYVTIRDAIPIGCCSIRKIECSKAFVECIESTSTT